MAQLLITNLDIEIVSGVTEAVTYCTIATSTATGTGAPIDATAASNVDGGTNAGWDFPALVSGVACLPTISHVSIGL